MALKNLLTILLLNIILISFGQRSTISGTVVDSKTLKPIANAVISVGNFEKVKSNSLGNFQLWNISYGKYSLKVTEPDHSPFYQEINLDSEYKYVRVRMGEVTTITGRENNQSTNTNNTNAETIYIRDTVIVEKIVYTPSNQVSIIKHDSTKKENESFQIPQTPSPSTAIPTIRIDDLNEVIDVNDDDDNDQVSGILSASNDPFYNVASFTFGTYRFRVRGLDSDQGKLYINNIEMNDQGLGRPSWNQWGGLNDVLKNSTSVHGLESSNFSFGGLNGARNIDIRASNQRKQLKASYSFSNRSYMHRVMATYSSGRLKGGWAVSLSGSYRIAPNDEISDKIRFNQEGTTYQAISWFAGIDKQLGKNHNLALNIFGASNKRGKSAAASQEMKDLAGSNYYNPNWGYQTEPDGKKYIRNAKVNDSYIPTAILMHDWKLKNNSSLKTSIAYRYGKNGSSVLDWRDATDPRPDYYRNMPSFALIENGQESSDAVASILANNINSRQIDWDKFYETNRINTEIVNNPNGSNDTASYNLAQYIVAERRYDPRTISFSSNYENIINEKITFNVGINYLNQKTHNYQKVKDLLGAESYIDINKFTARDFPGNDSLAQNDLNRFNRILKEGDHFGYDYDNHTRKYGIWAQTNLSFKKFDVFIANEFSMTDLWRTGYVKNGLFPDDSEGKSEVKNFPSFAIKGGITYKANGRNYLFANGSYGNRAPFIRNAMLSPRTRNDFVPTLENEINYSAEVGYILKAPKVKIRATAYASFSENKTTNRSVYFDFNRTFGNYLTTNIDTRHLGVEAGAEIELFTGFTLAPTVAWGEHTYTSRPNSTLIEDNSNTAIFEDRTVYFKGLHLSNGPQAAYSLGLKYRTSSYWFFELRASYFDKIYIDPTPIRRTEEALDNIPKDSDLWVDLLSQERMPGQFVMDASIGKSLKLNNIFKKLKKSQYINFNLNVGNLTHNTNFVTGGYEQSRFSTDKNLDRFQNKYYHAYGLNFFAQIAYRF